MSDMNNNEKQGQNDSPSKGEMTRRKFITVVGAIGIVAMTGGGIASAVAYARDKGADLAYPVSGGYLIVDSERCCGCQNCMMACAMTHFGETNPNLARIQIVGDSFQHFPLDMTIYQCHQCEDPKCVRVCPTQACHIDTEHDNVRIVSPEKCIGCMQCIEVCPNAPSRLQWNYFTGESQKCDLCHNTPYWDHPTGLEGTRACELICPEVAIKFVTELPDDTGDSQYDIDMRTGTKWPSMMTYAQGSTGNPGSEGSSKKS